MSKQKFAKTLLDSVRAKDRRVWVENAEVWLGFKIDGQRYKIRVEKFE